MGVLLWGSLIFLGVCLLSVTFVSVLYRNDKDSRALSQLCVILAAGCMYIMWATCYLHQLHPLIRPMKSAE